MYWLMPCRKMQPFSYKVYNLLIASKEIDIFVTFLIKMVRYYHRQILTKNLKTKFYC